MQMNRTFLAKLFAGHTTRRPLSVNKWKAYQDGGLQGNVSLAPSLGRLQTTSTGVTSESTYLHSALKTQQNVHVGFDLVALAPDGRQVRLHLLLRVKQCPPKKTPQF